MFYCDNCHSFFEEPVHELCPYCHVDDYVEAGQCEICGAWIEPGEDRCKYCQEQINEAMAGVMADFAGMDETGILRAIGDWVDERG